MTSARSTNPDRGIWICSQREPWARAVAAGLRVCTERQVGVLLTLDPGEISARVSKASLARPWPEDVCLLDLSLSSEDAPARMLAVYHRLRNEAFWVGPCVVAAQPEECTRLRKTPIVPGGACFGDFPSIHRFLAQPFQLVELLRNLVLVCEGTLELSEWTAIIEASPILRRLSEHLSALQAAVENGEARDVVLRKARRLSKAAADLCCEREFWHGPRYDACCRLQGFAKLKSAPSEQIGQLLEDARKVLEARWRTGNEQG